MKFKHQTKRKFPSLEFREITQEERELYKYPDNAKYYRPHQCLLCGKEVAKKFRSKDRVYCACEHSNSKYKTKGEINRNFKNFISSFYKATKIFEELNAKSKQLKFNF